MGTMKKIIITVRELDTGGTELSMLNLLDELIAQDCDITLLLSRKRGENLFKIPSNVKIIEIPFKREYERYYISDDESLISNSIQKYYIKFVRKLIKGVDKLAKYISWKSDIYNSYILRKTNPIFDKFDLAIDYYGYGIFNSKYISDYVIADKKVMWIHDERLSPISRSRALFDKFDIFYGVSNACVKAFDKEFPETRDRTRLFYNFIDTNMIKEKSNEAISDEIFNYNGFKLISVGRLENQKGFDLAIETAYELKKSGFKFKWGIVGEGSHRSKLEKMIATLNLSEEVILLGSKSNPYPYMKRCDIYVQPSRHEGYGLTVAEARALCKPIVATELNCFKEQIESGETGILVDFSVKAFQEALENLMLNPDLLLKLEKKLQKSEDLNISSKKELFKLLES